MAFYPRGYELTELLPDGRPVRKPASVISGQYTNRINRYSSPHEFMMILVVFKPGALYRLTGIPFHELHNRHEDLEAIFPKEAALVNTRLNSTDDYSEMIGIIEEFLLSILSKKKVDDRPVDGVFNLLLQSTQKYPLQWLASQACLSTRQFERLSQHYLGISPGLFARITRFNEAYKMRLQQPHLDWLSIAVSCDYHDYQHLVRDFREFANTTPTRLMEAEAKAMERKLGLNS